ncbi:flagellar export protein FliJ [Borrelia sp. MN22-0132]|uniref:flagellar export protein FliJ n=1 Tax=Borrelia sp. MN22-0132 TaxID=3085635 RepID=UPI003BA0620F
MNDLISKKKIFEKIVSLRTYDRKSSESDLINVNNKISKIEEFLEGISEGLNKLNNMDVFSKENYLDYLTYRKGKELRNLEKLKHEHDKYHDIYLKKYGEEKKVDILIKTLNDIIIKEKVKRESLFLDEYVNYRICKKLGNNQ